MRKTTLAAIALCLVALPFASQAHPHHSPSGFHLGMIFSPPVISIGHHGLSLHIAPPPPRVHHMHAPQAFSHRPPPGVQHRPGGPKGFGPKPGGGHGPRH